MAKRYFADYTNARVFALDEQGGGQFSFKSTHK